MANQSPNGRKWRIAVCGKRISFGHKPHNSAVTLQITVSQGLANAGMRENHRRIDELPDNHNRGFFQVKVCLRNFAARSLSNRSTSFSTRLRMN